MSGVRVVPAESRRDRKAFLELPWVLYRGDPNWIPPLRGNQKELVGYRRHAFLEDAQVQTFIARRGSEVCGRVAAILNRAYLEQYPNQPLGFFGFFESIDDQEVATALLQAARDWLAERNLRVVRGPANPSMNYECGLLVEGFDSPPTFMMTYNPPYYGRLLENFGFRKAHDLFAYIGHISQLDQMDEKLNTIAEQCIERFGISVRPLDRNKFQSDVELFLRLYNSSMVFTWGFVAMSPSEVRQLGGSLKYLMDPELALFTQVDGKTEGAILCVPDYNPRIKAIDGRLFPFGFIKLLSRKRDIKRVRVMAINVSPDFQRYGLGLVLMRALVPKAKELGIQEAEFSWVLESNELARMGLEKGGAKQYKTYRMYDYQPPA